MSCNSCSSNNNTSYNNISGCDSPVQVGKCTPDLPPSPCPPCGKAHGSIYIKEDSTMSGCVINKPKQAKCKKKCEYPVTHITCKGNTGFNCQDVPLIMYVDEDTYNEECNTKCVQQPKLPITVVNDPTRFVFVAPTICDTSNEVSPCDTMCDNVCNKCSNMCDGNCINPCVGGYSKSYKKSLCNNPTCKNSSCVGTDCFVKSTSACSNPTCTRSQCNNPCVQSNPCTQNNSCNKPCADPCKPQPCPEPCTPAQHMKVIANNKYVLNTAGVVDKEDYPCPGEKCKPLDICTKLKYTKRGVVVKPYFVPGLRGPRGPPGECGKQGRTGKHGPFGTRGPRGDNGLPGCQGKRGPCGTHGPPGQRGVRGNNGPIGPSGPQGKAGYQGPSGPPSNVPGPRGFKGCSGERGLRGSVGPCGNQGKPGMRGLSGPEGKRGSTGPPGPQGQSGCNKIMYDGRVTLDSNGEYVVTSVKQGSRVVKYQLTPIGSSAIVYIKQELTNSEFIIGGPPNVKVCWQVTL